MKKAIFQISLSLKNPIENLLKTNNIFQSEKIYTITDNNNVNYFFF